MANLEEKAAFGEWCIVELFGHRKLAGYVEEVTIGGASFLRLDIYPGLADEPTASQFYNPSAVYCMTPTTAETARAFAARAQPKPVSHFELGPVYVPDDGRDEDEEDPF